MGCDVFASRSSSVMRAGAGTGDGSVDCFSEDAVESSSESGAVVFVEIEWSSGSMTVDGRADGDLGWA